MRRSAPLENRFLLIRFRGGGLDATELSDRGEAKYSTLLPLIHFFALPPAARIAGQQARTTSRRASSGRANRSESDGGRQSIATRACPISHHAPLPSFVAG